ncbi:hypothetical protein BJX64DRAFT_294843 [Aspergillus heterothallicus]
MDSLERRTLATLPNEVLLLVFLQCATTSDACALALTCRHFYGIFSPRRTRTNILRSAADVPKSPRYIPRNGAAELLHIPPYTWVFPSSQVSTRGLLMESDYGPLSEDKLGLEVWDLGEVQKRQNDSQSFDSAVLAFLLQFQEQKRWLLMFEYEAPTVSLLQGAANLQREILESCRSSFTPTDLSSERMVLALAFHCLAVSRNIALVTTCIDASLEERKLFKNGSPITILQAGYEDHTLLPTVRLHKKTMQHWAELRQAANTTLPGYALDAAPSVMLEYIMQSSFRLLNTRDPRHWPTVLLTLLVLYLARFNYYYPLQPCLQGISHAAGEFLTLITDLARYYYICTEGAWILSEQWSKTEYLALVGEDEMASRYAVMLNELWRSTGASPSLSNGSG